MKCPKCGCPFFTGVGYRTADMPRAWQDDTGEWYCGPAQEDTTYTCNGCGYSYEEHYRRGKKVEKVAP